MSLKTTANYNSSSFFMRFEFSSFTSYYKTLEYIDMCK